MKFHEKMKLKDMKPNPDNPRVRDDKLIKNIIKSFKKFGVCAPIIINHDKMIIGGHMRYEAALELEYKTLPAVELTQNYNEQELKGLNIALNQIDGVWDVEKLHEVLTDLKSDDDILDSLGFDDFELSAILDVSYDKDIDEIVEYDESTFDDRVTSTNEDNDVYEIIIGFDDKEKADNYLDKVLHSTEKFKNRKIVRIKG